MANTAIRKRVHFFVTFVTFVLFDRNYYPYTLECGFCDFDIVPVRHAFEESHPHALFTGWTFPAGLVRPYAQYASSRRFCRSAVVDYNITYLVPGT